MAQLKDTLITGDLRVTGTIYGINNNAADADHTHGNIQKGGTLQTTDVTIATGDKLVITDSSDSHKVARASISFNTSSTTSFLRNDGKWATPANTTYTFTTTGTGNAVTAVTLSGTTVTVNKGATYNNYTHPAYTSRESDVYKITVDETGHVSAASAATAADIGAAAATHSHGNITSDGKVGTASNKALYTGTSGTVTSGTLPVAAGGTGATSFTANSLIMSGSTTTAALTTRAITNNTSNAATTTGTNIPTMSTIYYGQVLVNGAGQTRATNIHAPTGNAPGANAILYATGTASTSTVSYKATANGALYATGTNSALTFGTLPIAQGGTGATTASAALAALGGSSGITIRM